nr:SulP family inorganic anion transporter [Gulosibacter bifidus]
MNEQRSEPPALTVWTAVRRPRILIKELLAGLVVAIALIPEAIAFSIILGVDPKVGLFSSCVMAVTIAFVGGRPAMITAATGAIALVLAPLVREHGVDYLLATVLLTGILQILLAIFGVAKLMRFIPRSVMIGFVNALAILIFVAQLPHLINVPVTVYVLVAIALIILVLLPKLTQVIPAPLVAIAIVTGITVIWAMEVPTVGGQGELPRSLPELVMPNVPLTWETLRTIAPFAATAALVGLMESLMTAKLVDEITDTPSNKTRESWGQGVANIASGMFGGMGGCAVIGQTMINVKASGARTRISTFAAGVLLLVLIVVLGDIVAIVPMAALVAVMVMVTIGTFDWHSVAPKTLRLLPPSETAVMVITVIATVATGNLAIGVITGVLAASIMFVRRVAHLVDVQRECLEVDGHEVARYTVTGQLLFASSNDLTTMFRYTADPAQVEIDLSQSHIWDASSVAAIDAIVTKYEQRGTTVTVTGANAYSEMIRERLSGNLNS